MPSELPPERRSLLQGSRVDQHGAITPLPKLQLAVIFAIKLSITLGSQQTLPYINQLLADQLGKPSKEVGYYSGIIFTAGTLFQFLSAYPWGRASDRLGRVPPLFLSTLIMGVASLIFGTASAFPVTVFARSLVGLSGGSVGIMHSVVGDLTDKTNASTAFPLYDIVAAVGFIVGPLIGGLLVRPHESMPSLFPSQIWVQYPYLLPCLVAAGYSFFVCVLSWTSLQETNPRRTVKNYVAVSTDAESTVEVIAKPPGARELLSSLVFRLIAGLSGSIGFIASAFNAFFALLAYADIVDGGLGLKPAKIGIAISLMGAISIPLKLSLPIILRKWSTATVYRASLRAWPITFAALPLLSLFARFLGENRSSMQEVGLWIAISIVLFLSRVGCLTFGLTMLLVKEHTALPSVLGSANALTEVTQMLGGLVGPPLITSLFAFSITNNVLGGYLWAVVGIALSFAMMPLANAMVRQEALAAARERPE